MQSKYFPLKGKEKLTALNNIKTSTIKSLVKNTFLRGNIIRYFKLLTQANLSFWETKRVFFKMQRGYKLDTNGTNPLMNDYNFRKF